MIGANFKKTGENKLKVALVHDYLNQYGGAERVLECLAEMFPDAPIYTLFYDKKLMRGRFKDRVIFTSFLDNLLVRRNHRWFIPFFPAAAERLNLKSKYDLIISDSAGFAKGVRHNRGIHISYMHSPLRYAWEPERYLENLLPKRIIKMAKPILRYLRRWDYEAAQKPLVVLANSRYIADKISDYYDRPASVLYPPVDNKVFFLDSAQERSEHIPREFDHYYLAFGRMIHYKKFDLVIEAFNTLGLPLLIAGVGKHKKTFEKAVKSTKIKILPGHVGDEELRKIVSGAKALIFPQVEDFGLVAAEAISCGTPVIAYAEGGAKEIIEEGKNGIFFKKQHPESLIKAVKMFENHSFDRKEVQASARKFSKENFKRKFSEIIQKHINFYDTSDI